MKPNAVSVRATPVDDTQAGSDAESAFLAQHGGQFVRGVWSAKTDEEVNIILAKQDAMMHRLATEHMARNKGHKCSIYGNFIHCDCGFHAHCGSSGDYMVQHNADYSVNEHIS